MIRAVLLTIALVVASGLQASADDGWISPKMPRDEVNVEIDELHMLRTAVSACWNVGALPTEALATDVKVSFLLDRTGLPMPGSIEFLGYRYGEEPEARLVFESARRAILRCAGQGYPLSADKSEPWQKIELVFGPEGIQTP